MKTLEEMSFDDLVQYCQGMSLLAIPKGGFNMSIWTTCELAVRWSIIQSAKKDKK